MIYLDNAATSFPKAPGVAEAMVRFLESDAANPGRSGHAMAVRAEKMLQDARLRVARLIEAESPDRIIFTLNATDALNIAIKGVVRGLPASRNLPHVVTTVLEHNSVSRPLESLAQQGRISLTRVGCDAGSFVSPDAIEAAMTERTVMVVMTHASNVLGTVQDAAAVGALCRQQGALFCLDAAQTAGVWPVSADAWNADLIAFPAHKSLLGPTGVGVLYVGPRCPAPGHAFADDQAGAGEGNHPLVHRMAAWREGGTGGDSASPLQPSDLPHFFEGGTPNTVGIAGLVAALGHLRDLPLDHRLAHEQALIDRLVGQLRQDERITLFGPADRSRCVGVLSLNIAGYEAQDVAAILDDSFEIAVRAGLHCSPYAHRAIGTFATGTVRISPGPTTTADEIDACAEALLQIAAS